MFQSLWKKAVMARMSQAAKRAKLARLACEPLEDRTTPAAVQQIVATTVDPGSPPIVTVYDAATQQVKFTVQAYDPSFTGGVRVAVGDVNGDGVQDVITGAGAGGGPVVKVFSGVDGQLLKTFFAGDETNRGGVSVAAADFDGDGRADIVVGAIQNGLELVQVLKGADGTVLEQFRPFQASIEGVSVAAGDYNGDGTPDVVVGAGIGGAPRVTVLDGKTGEVLLNTFAFDPAARGGVLVAAGDLNGDGRAEIVAAPGAGGGPQVVAFAGGTGDLLHSFFAYNPADRDGVQVAVFDVDGDGVNDIVTTNGSGQAPDVKAFDGRTLAPITLPQFTGLPFGQVEVTAFAPTAFSADSPPEATVGEAYSYTFVANGLPAPAYAVSSGSLPPGLTLGGDGVLSGTPTAVGSYAFVVTATNSAGSLASSSVTLTVSAVSAANSSVTSPVDGGSLTSGDATVVTFTARDAAGNPVTGLTAGDVTFGLTAGSVGGGSFNPVTFTDLGGGSYSEVFTAATAGAITFTATVGGVTVTDASSVIVAGVTGPSISSVNPNTGPTTGGTPITITGTGFTGATAVTIGGATVTIFAVNSDSQIIAFTPPGVAGVVDVSVTTAGGTATAPGGTATAPGAFTYAAAPTVSGVSPNTGPATGGTTVTITGTNFTGATAVRFGAVAVPFLVVSDTQITAVAPAGAAGTVDVTVTTTGGTSATSAADHFTYVAAPTISNVSPNSGPTAGGVTITITGAGFADATAVTIGGHPATNFTVVSDTEITAVVPARVAGPADVAVTTAGGTATDAEAFTYVAAPVILAVSPNTGSTNGGDTVTITGAGLSGATAVTIGGNPVSNFSVDSDNQITAVVPAGVAGTVDVAVTTAGGTVTDSNAFTYLAPPTITGINPSSGSTNGGNSVTITGTGLTFTSSVTFGGIPAAFAVIADNTIVVTTPAAAAGPVDVVVTTTGGSATAAGGYTYVSPPGI